MASQLPKVKLNNGLEMPIIGVGTYQRGEPIPGQWRQAVEWAIEVGYRHIDTAKIHGYNEEEVGEAIENKIKEGVVKREDLFITNKLWNDSHAERDVLPALKKSLRRMKLKYFDLYLINWPVSINEEGKDTNIDYIDTWKGMEAALELGHVKSIGVSNFNKDQLERVIRYGNIKPVVNQIEISPTMTQHELVNYCKGVDVVPVAFTPLGLLSNARPEHSSRAKIKTDPRLGEIADKYGKTKFQVVLRYLVHRGIPAIPKAFKKEHLIENINIFDFKLTPAEVNILNTYNVNHRCVPGNKFRQSPYFPFV